MKKFGFTLAELLIAMGIIGVVAAMTVPSLSQFRPDKDKMMVLKTYKTIMDANKELLSDPSLYMTDGNCEGLLCAQLPTNPKYSIYKDTDEEEFYTGFPKYANLLIESLDAEAPQKCNDAETCHFTTSNGVNWFISGLPDEESYSISVRFDDQDNLDHAQTFDDNQRRPNLFTFMVPFRENGAVYGHDSLTRAYLENPDKLNNKKADYRRATAIKDGCN